ncbi:MAG: hypothetical protein BAJATHORv1_20649 [Candidatus Thorarchaeota archaeon]|nr:MAG: hypothetical protein BAJATHORv1_20649 [Candidatus Thorarchaeota archaeon]
MPDSMILFDPTDFLALEGVDDYERLTGQRNPFWNRARLESIWSLPKMAGLLESSSIRLQPMRLATREELGIFHDPSYIETMELFGNMGSAFSARFGLDTEECPVFLEMDKYASYPVGSAIDAMMAVAEGKAKTAMSIFGGLHHALESKAAGFCYYNDCVIALKKYREKYPENKILYLDTDVHHGDGTQHAFYNDPNVLTISTHELSMGFFPGTGRPEEIGIGDGKGYSVNVPLPPLTDDFAFWKAFEEVVVPLWLAYRPDIVFWEIGADAHYGDPLADLMLTMDTYQRMSRTVRQLAYLGECGVVAVGGGGYNPVIASKIFSLIIADLAGVALPPSLPADWIELCREFGLGIHRGGWTDRPVKMSCEHEPKIMRVVDETIKKVKELVFPIIGVESLDVE